MAVLIADIGGTSTRGAVVVPRAPLLHAQVFANDQFPSLAALLATYLKSLPATERPRSACLAVAAPVLGDTIRMSNRAWEFSQTSLRKELGLDSLTVMNDFAAQAWAVTDLPPEETVAVGEGKNLLHAPCAVIGPGTGLGVAGLFRADNHWHVLPGEGGHVSLPAQDDEEERIVRAARDRFGHCSAERILSGPGLSFLHSVLTGGEEQAPAAVGDAAVAGDPAARKTLEIFFCMLGTVASDLALTLAAFGGVYVTGGIVPRYVGLMQGSGFRARFEAKGRYDGYLAQIATKVVTSELPGLQGLRNFALARG